MNPGSILQHLSRVNKLSTVAFAVVGIAVVAGLLLAFAVGSAAARTGSSTAATSTCVGKDLYPGQDIAAVAKAAPVGSTFCIHDGEYSVSSNIQVQSGDVFQGMYSDNSRPHVLTTQAEHIFHTIGSTGATIKNLMVKGAVGGDYCEPNCGRGIGGGGSNLLVENVRAIENANQGIGGAGPNLVVRDSIFKRNGYWSFARDTEGEPVSAAGIKSVNSMYIYNSQFIDNYWNGVWCDIECNAFEVHDSVLSGNGKAGIHYEISSGPAVVEGNTIQNNGYLAEANRHTGLLVVASQNLNAYGNTFSGNRDYGFETFPDPRGNLSNIHFHDNTMNSDALKGCELSAVSCYTND
jgi:hypothetical protein